MLIVPNCMTDSCKYNDSNVVDVSCENKENKINVKTTFVNKRDDNNTVDVRNVNKVNKVNVKSTSVNNHNNSDNEKLERRRAMCVFVKRVSIRSLACVRGCQSMYYCIRNCQLKRWKQHQVLCKAKSQLVTESKEKINQAGVYSTILAP